MTVNKALLVLFFTFYYIFMPFVLSGCGVEDQPYLAPTDKKEAVNCDDEEFLVADCVDAALAESESETTPSTTTAP